MRKTTSALAAAILGAGSAVVLSVAVPGTAGASGCGNTTVYDNDLKGWVIPYQPNNPSGTTTGSEISFAESGGLNMSIQADGRAIARRDISVAGIPLAEQTAQSDYTVVGDATGVTGFSYQLVMDMHRPDTDGFVSNFTQLVYEPGARDGWYSTRALPRTGQGAGEQENDRTLAEISEAYPNATIQAFLVQLGKVSSTQIAHVDSVQFGCNVFTFEQAPNVNPVADFTSGDAGDSDWRTVKFTGTASDQDGDAINYVNWTYGDGSGGGGDVPAALTPPVKTYAAPGDYTVTLTVRDARGGEAVVTKTVTVARPADTVQDEHLAGTGADVLGLATIGGLVVVGSAAGLIINRRRKANASA